jgi:hypothetical protein
LAKEYFEGETKDQRKARKAKEKLAKAQKNVASEEVLPQENVITQLPKEQKDIKNYIVCLKHGTKYSSLYVNVLYNMVKRHTTIPYEFVCFTDDTRDINPDIRTIPLKPIGVYGWWYKVIFFDKNFPLDGNILYFDLDVVINSNIDRLFLNQPDKFNIIRDFNRSLRNDWSRMNSSVFRLKTGSLSYVYDNFFKNHAMEIRRHHGDQDWIFAQVGKNKNDWCFWPDEWIQSYKWEMRDRNDLDRINGIRNFKNQKEPKVLPQTCVAVFHGEPHPHQCNDKWVKENWK